MRLDTSGNVGIGTSSPGSKFAVISGTSPNIATIQVGYSGSANYYDANLHSFRNGAQTEVARIDSSGNVGIGTSSSAARLGVVNDQAALSYLFDTSNVTNGGSSLWRMITRNIANTGTTSVDFYKPSGTGFSIINNDTNASNFTAFNVGISERMRIDSSGNVLVTNPAGLGYGTGSGGTVTQATDKSTAVTLNKPTGQITMNNAALLGTTAVVFRLNDSLIASVDTVIYAASGNGNYEITTHAIFAGAVDIRVTNATVGSLSEALVINFSILKGATS